MMSAALDLSTRSNRANTESVTDCSLEQLPTKEQPTEASKPTKKRKTKSTGPPYSSVPLPPCKVCGGTSTGYHFGVITCEACKMFFRRALIHKQEYKCAKDNNCYASDKKQGNCSACRWRRCIALGMSKGGVRKGRYSIALRTNAIIEAKASQGKHAAQSGPLRSRDDTVTSSTSTYPDSSMPSPLDDLLRASDIVRANAALTSTETGLQKRNMALELLIDALIGCQDAVYPNLKKIHECSILDAQHRSYHEHQMKQKMFNELFGKPNTVTTEEYQQIFAETGIDLDDRLTHFNTKGKAMEEAIAQYVNFAKIIPGFKSLNPKDVSQLLKASHLEFWIFGNYMLLNKDLGVAVSWDGTHNSTKKDIRKFWSEAWVEEVFKYADRIQKLNLCMEEIVLIRVIVLTYTDRCNLSDREQIQVLQEKYLECLVYQLSKNSQRPNRRLSRIFDILLQLRDFTEMNVKENKEFLGKWEFVINEFPLWKEMLSYSDELN